MGAGMRTLRAAMLGLGLAWAAAAGPAPAIDRFEAQAVPGDPARFRLSWSLSGGAPATLTLEDDLTGQPPRNVLGLGPGLLQKVVRRQTFTLRAGNAAGASSASLTLAVRGLALLAGDVAGAGSLDGPSETASFQRPGALAADGHGGVVLCDQANATIRHIRADGQVVTLAGTPGEEGWRDGRGPEARFKYPAGIAVDPDSGMVYVADMGNQVVRSITPGGEVQTLAGVPGKEGADDGPGATATFSFPTGLALVSGSLVVCDTQNCTLRTIDLHSGRVDTLAGTPGQADWADGDAHLEARFMAPMGVAATASGDLLVADTFNHVVRRVAGGRVTTLAGLPGESGTTDGAGQDARLFWPGPITVGPEGGCYVVDMGSGRIRALAGGRIRTVAGAEPDGSGRFRSAEGLAWVRGGLVLADTARHVLRRVSPAGELAMFAGREPAADDRDGRGGGAHFQDVAALVVDPDTGDALVGEAGEGHLRRVTRRGEVLTLHDHQTGKELRFPTVAGLALDGDHRLLVACLGDRSLRRLAHGGEPEVLLAPPGPDPPPGALHAPFGVAAGPEGDIFCTDTLDWVVRRLSPQGVLETFAGNPDTLRSADGLGTAAGFRMPMGLAADWEGNLYVAETGAHVIRKITRAGCVSTLAGQSLEAGARDGRGGEARFHNPQGLAVDPAGNVYVADTGNGTVRRISPEGDVTTVAGTPGRLGATFGPLPGTLARPTALAVTPAGDLLVVCENGLVQITDP